MDFSTLWVSWPKAECWREGDNSPWNTERADAVCCLVGTAKKSNLEANNFFTLYCSICFFPTLLTFFAYLECRLTALSAILLCLFLAQALLHPVRVTQINRIFHSSGGKWFADIFSMNNFNLHIKKYLCLCMGNLSEPGDFSITEATKPKP